MSKKVVILASSPRRSGNTNTVTGWVMDGVRKMGAEVECIDVTDLEYEHNGCISCYGCQRSEKYECVVRDDATEVLKRIADADVLVFSTPVYFFGPNAQLKLILDRMFCLAKFDPETGEPIMGPVGEKLALIATAGGDMEGGLGLTDKLFKTMARFVDRPYESLLVPTAPHDPKEMQGNLELKDKAVAFGRQLCAGDD